MVLKKQLGQTGNKVNFDVCLKVVLSTRRQLLLLLIGLKWGRGGGGGGSSYSHYHFIPPAEEKTTHQFQKLYGQIFSGFLRLYLGRHSRVQVLDDCGESMHD